MVDRIALLADLQKQVKALEVDLREQVDTVQSIGEPLRLEYDTAFRLGRTAETRRAWEDERITQAAVAWVLGTVFVRFCEDNGLIADRYLAGATPADLVLAEEGEAHYFRTDPDPTFRGWLERAFEALATTRAGQSLFDRTHNPLYRIPVSHDGAKALVNFWRRRDDAVQLVHDFRSATWDTRFLGDLYQDLSEAARKRYALLQTPEFVEKFILDRTLTPAVAEFGHEDLKMIDPTCGSGHFVLEAFHRILDCWEEAPGRDQYERVRLALNAVHGVDVNPFAVAIARFRLFVAALKACGIATLDEAKGLDFPLHLAVGDSLIKAREPGLFGATSPEEFAYATEDLSDHPNILTPRYHVVVGNPPYITVNDESLNKLYRRTYANVCYRQYALSVPFARRFFELAKPEHKDGSGAGYVGQITANSFMKREFGRMLIGYFASWVNLTEIIDISGVPVPGHGTPTVMLIGRNTNRNRADTIRTVMGIRGEAGPLEDVSKGPVWRSIIEQIDKPGSESEWVSVADTPRSSFASHPWSLGGGGAAALAQALTSKAKTQLKKVAKEVGFIAITGEDDAFLAPRDALRRAQVEMTIPMVDGKQIRDFIATGALHCVFPYDADLQRMDEVDIPNSVRFLWPYRRKLEVRRRFGKPIETLDYLAWYDLREFYREKLRLPLSIAFAFVATHNHFVLTRGGKLFKQSSPVIKLPEGTSEDDHLKLLGLLNSSTACFWLKQVSHNKGSQGVNEGFKSQEWERFYEFAVAKVEQFPVPKTLPLQRARRIDELARRLITLTPAAIAASGVPTRDRLATARTEYEAVRAQMIAEQEELDWEVYRHYGLLQEDLTSIAPPALRLGERAFEIVLAQRMSAGEVQTQWFDRHRSTPIAELPKEWHGDYRALVQQRIDLIKSDRNIGLIERPEYKRRWLSEPWAAMEKRALREWLAECCERRELWYSVDEHGLEQPRPLSVNQLADLLRTDDDVLAVAELYEPGRDLAKLLAKLLDEEHVPFLAALRYKPSGLAKRRDWEHVWELQRAEDAAGDDADKRKIKESIPIPQKYTSADFPKKSYWDKRDKLDIPKERFISYPHCGRNADPSLLLGWAGWDHREQAHVLATLVAEREQRDNWGADRLAPLLAGLREVMPWVRQWHRELDPQWGASPADEYDAFLTETAQRLHLTDEGLAAWRPPEVPRSRHAKAPMTNGDNVRP
ncbi:BREX-2 system adenine-specific DNA-methyltransferase PglX [Actinomycetes bacterium KLBMP 9797]